MANLNRFEIIGNLVRDLEKVEFPNGGSKVRGAIASNRQYTDKNNEKKEEAFFIDFDVFGPGGDILAKYAAKGDSVFLEGRLRNDTWQDKESGDKRSKTMLVVENFQFLSTRKEGAEQPAKPAAKGKTKDKVPF